MISYYPIASKRVGAFLTSRSCHATKYDWLLAIIDPENEVPHYERFSLPPGGPCKPRTLAEAHLAASQMGSDQGEYGFWKAQFEAWLDYIAANWFTDPDIILLSDRESKAMVVQQYDPDNPITMNATRLQKIAEFLINVEDPQTSPWQIGENEWEVLEVNVTRPPNYVKITIDTDDEYYSLSEAYWHMLSALNDLANEIAIDYKALDLVIGPCEPSICPKTTSPFVAEEDSVYRVLVWWQHDYEPIPTFSYDSILKQVPALFNASKSEEIGPNFPDSSRRKVLGKVKALWEMTDDLGNQIQLNAAEILYLLSMAMNHYFHPETSDIFTLFPSHILPKGYKTFIENGRFKNIFGEDNQLNWFDIGQRWTLKPAILEEPYR